MKQIFTFFVIFVIVGAMSNAQDTIYVHQTGGMIAKIAVNKIDSIIFYAATTPAGTTMTDYDGNVYPTVTIGTQTWMAKNLRTTHYTDGTVIPLVSGNSNWDALTATDKAYCWYNDDSATNAVTYGALYTWAAAMNGAASSSVSPSGIQGVCPMSWHLPSDDEWTVLENYLNANGYNFDGTTTSKKIAKALASTTGWNSSTYTGVVGNTDYPTYRNKSGFTALPGGDRNIYGTFSNIGNYGFWWSATQEENSYAWHRYLIYEVSWVGRNSNNREVGYSVRCVKD